MSRGVPYANVKDRQRETIASKKPLEYRWNYCDHQDWAPAKVADHNPPQV